MNNNVKKILYIALPIVIAILTIAIAFYIKTNQFSKIMQSTNDSELISYEIVKDSFQSNETAESTPDAPEYQSKIILLMHNMAKYDLEYFDVTIEFVEEGTDELWSYTQEDFSFYGDTKLIVSQTRPNKATNVHNVYITFSGDDKQVYIVDTNEYEDLYGKNNTIISPITYRVYKTLALASIMLTIVVAVTAGMLILVCIDTEKPKKKVHNTSDKVTINTSNKSSQIKPTTKTNNMSVEGQTKSQKTPTITTQKTTTKKTTVTKTSANPTSKATAKTTANKKSGNATKK